MVLHEEVANWFDVWDGFESPYMSFAVPFLPSLGLLYTLSQREMLEHDS